MDPFDDDEFGPPLVDGELPPFWKPEAEGERRVGEILAIRHTKDFGEGQGSALDIRGAEGIYSLPVSAGLARVDWRRQIGRIFRFTFIGWEDLDKKAPDGSPMKVRKWRVEPSKRDDIPF